MKTKILEYQNSYLAKTKSILLGLTFVLSLSLSNSANAQGMPVYDNTNFISLVKSLVESAKQTSQLIQTVKFLKKQKENIEKVNSVVKQMKAVREIGRNNERLVQVMRKDLREILNSFFIKPDEVERVSDSFNALVENSLETMDFIDQILSSDFLKMTDAERTEILKQKERESKEMVSSITIRTKRYRDIISFRKMQDRVNNREASF